MVEKAGVLMGGLKYRHHTLEMSDAPKFRLNVVFHKFLVPECYEELEEEVVDAHIRFVAVNAKIPKSIPSNYDKYVIEERGLPWYNPFLQHNRFCESSAFFHAWRNPDRFLQQAYIGFVHYDMILKKEAIEFLTTHIDAAEKASNKLVFAPYCHVARPHLTQIISLNSWDRIVQIYNMIFHKNHSIHDVVDAEIPMYHTFVVHREIFHRMMIFAEVAIPRLFEMLQFDTRHLPFMIERLHGICLYLQRLDGVGETWLPLPGIVHEDRLKDAWEKPGGA